MKKTVAAARFAAKCFAATIAAISLFSAPSFAQPPVYTWTGFYVGAVGGGEWNKTTFNDPGFNWTTTGRQNNRDTAPNLGGTLGYNWQSGDTVLGIEGDWSWTDYSKHSVGYPGVNGSTVNSGWDSFGTIRGRAGKAVGNALIYVTGGAAFVKVDNNARWFDPYNCANPSYGWSSCVSGVRTGITLGGGAEMVLTGNLSAKIEYLFIDLDSVQRTDVLGHESSWKDTAHVLRFGLNWKFGG